MKYQTANSAVYITGWVCSQLDHSPRIEKLATNYNESNNKLNLDNTHTGIEEFKSCNSFVLFQNIGVHRAFVCNSSM
jgi:hypothetical protein